MPAMRSLSGGNMQKVIVAREFSAEPALLVAAQPTRGVDIGATEFVHNQLVAKRNEGKAVLLVSADLAEVMSLADRIAVMYKGEIVGILENGAGAHRGRDRAVHARPQAGGRGEGRGAQG
jgi:ABC-type uncharacterized transport system ATPase subunit